jgi:cobalt transporter subunit CbtB
MRTVSATPSFAATGHLAKWPALVAFVLGVLVVFGAGFASPAALHNATHDTRHAFGLPCH